MYISSRNKYVQKKKKCRPLKGVSYNSKAFKSIIIALHSSYGHFVINLLFKFNLSTGFAPHILALYTFQVVSSLLYCKTNLHNCKVNKNVSLQHFHERYSSISQHEIKKNKFFPYFSCSVCTLLAVIAAESCIHV